MPVKISHAISGNVYRSSFPKFAADQIFFFFFFAYASCDSEFKREAVGCNQLICLLKLPG